MSIDNYSSHAVCHKCEAASAAPFLCPISAKFAFFFSRGYFSSELSYCLNRLARAVRRLLAPRVPDVCPLGITFPLTR